MGTYGYPEDLDLDQLEYLNHVTNDDYDRESMSTHFREFAMSEIGLMETSEVYSQRFRAHTQTILTAQAATTKPNPGLRSDQEASWQSVAPAQPTLNIYLRPATVADLEQVTEIYNWHLENGPRATEIHPVSESDMRDRFDDATDHKLPFVVAVEKTRPKRWCKGRKRTSNVAEEEKIVGWACAQDFTASDYVERISAEVEIYVAHNYRLLGVGTCLMDKMIQICDRGYLPKGGYSFVCLPEKNHLYSEGGGRDLHKIYLFVRTWSKPPRTPSQRERVGSEDDYEQWMKNWLESRWGFEQEGRLKEVGARNGRYIDNIQLGRVTMWQPMDGEIPEALPGTT